MRRSLQRLIGDYTNIFERDALASSMPKTTPPPISQNHPGIIEIKGLKTSHFKECKTAPWGMEQTGSMGDVECPQSEPANNDLHLAIVDGRSDQLRASWGSIAKRCAGGPTASSSREGSAVTYDFDVITGPLGSVWERN
jgi:hypothetical protein